MRTSDSRRSGQKSYRQLILIFSISVIKKLTIYDSTLKNGSRLSCLTSVRNEVMKNEQVPELLKKMRAKRRESIKNLSIFSLAKRSKDERGRGGEENRW